MVPPPLPDSTFVIAPNAAVKRKRRPVFRPGQRPAKGVAPKKVAPENDKKKDRGDESENPSLVSNAGSEKATNLDRNDGQDATQNEDTAENSTAGIPKPSLEPETQSPSKDALPGDKSKESVDAPNTSAPKTSTGEKVAPKLASALKKPKANATTTKANTASFKTKVASPIQAKLSSPIKVKTSLVSKSATSTQSNSTQLKPGTSKETTKPAKSGRKRKPTGLVIGASTRKKGKQDILLEDDEQKQDLAAEASNQVATLPPGRVPPLLPSNLPPPLEGEAALTLFCSKFRSKPHHPPDKSKKKQKQKSKEKEKEPEPEPEEAVPVVQIINGEIVLQESSMVVEERGGSAMRRSGADDEEYTVVEEDSDLTIVNADYHSFTNRTKPSRWTKEETKLFYEALRQVGTNFVFMAEFFKNRNRKQLKRKFKQESTKNERLVDMALHPSQQKPLDLSVFNVTDAQVQEQKEATKKREIEEKEAKAKAEAEAKSKKEDTSKSKEYGMEVIFEDEEEEDEFGGDKEEKSAMELLFEASLPPEPTKRQNHAEEDDVVEEDPMMLEDYQSYENFDEGHGPDGAESEKRAEPEIDEPTLSLLPNANANKKKKKPKFKTARLGRKKI